MKKAVGLWRLGAALVVGFAFASLMSCNAPDDVSNDQVQAKKTGIETGKKVGDGQVTNSGGVTSYKLILVNNLTAGSGINFGIEDIFASKGATSPNSNYFIHFKGTATLPYTIAPGGSSVTYSDYVNATSNSIPNWHIENVPLGIDTYETASQTLANYGITPSGSAPNVKYAFWTGVRPYVVYNGVTYFGTNASQTITYNIGRSPFVPDTIIKFGLPGGIACYAQWEILSNGDCKASLHY